MKQCNWVDLGDPSGKHEYATQYEQPVERAF